MDLYFNHDMKHNVVSVERTDVMVQYVFRFENDYGASLIKRPGSYGYRKDLWELAVLYFDGDEREITYDTEITDDVLGYLTDEEVIMYLEQIRDL